MQIVKRKRIFTQAMLDWLSKNACRHNYDTLKLAFNKRFKTNLSRNTINFCCNDRKIEIGERLHGYKPREHLPLGTERIRDCGFAGICTYAKVACTGVKTKDWKLKQHHIWEKANGKPIPKNHVIIFADNNKSNFEPDNLVCISRAEAGVLGLFGFYFDNAERTRAGVTVVKHRIAISNAMKRAKKTKRKKA